MFMFEGFKTIFKGGEPIVAFGLSRKIVKVPLADVLQTHVIAKYAVDITSMGKALGAVDLGTDLDKLLCELQSGGASRCAMRAHLEGGIYHCIKYMFKTKI